MRFTVLVVGDDVLGQLAPFQENNLGTCPEEYLKFIVEVPKKDIEAYIKKWLNSLSNEHKAICSMLSNSQLMEKGFGYTTNENGDYGCIVNPNAQWDFWLIGGRWRGYFKLKPGKKGILGSLNPGKVDRLICPNGVDQARKGDIDFEGSHQARLEKAESNWERCYSPENKLKRENDRFFKFRFGIMEDEPKELYIKHMTSIATFAVLKDGKWYEAKNIRYPYLSENKKDFDE